VLKTPPVFEFLLSAVTYIFKNLRGKIIFSIYSDIDHFCCFPPIPEDTHVHVALFSGGLKSVLSSSFRAGLHNQLFPFAEECPRFSFLPKALG